MNRTRWIIVFTVLAIGALDVVLALTGGVEATISFQITQWSFEYPVIAFALGFLMGHFFGQNKRGTPPV